MLSDGKWDKLEISNRKKFEEFPNIWKINLEAKEEIIREVSK